jgi:hypothetical protein
VAAVAQGRASAEAPRQTVRELPIRLEKLLDAPSLAL